MTRGTVAWVDLRDAASPEFGKTRPALVLSNTELNESLSTVVVVPISTRPGDIWPLRLPMPKISAMKLGWLVLPGIRQVNKARLRESAGLVSDDFLKEVGEAVAAYLGD